MLSLHDLLITQYQQHLAMNAAPVSHAVIQAPCNPAVYRGSTEPDEGVWGGPAV